MDNGKTVGANINFFTSLLCVLFVGLKLTGYIDWSWKWVLSPLWITLAIAGVIIILMTVYKFIHLKRDEDARIKRQGDSWGGLS